MIDLYSVKPLDEATLIEAARATGRVVTVEDHWPEGGIGEAVFEALAQAGVGVAASLLAPRKHARLGHARRKRSPMPASMPRQSSPPPTTC